MLPSEVDVPYPAWPIPEASPERIAAMALIAGVARAPTGTFRVLELGCASGGNLLPLASRHPRSEFVGVDLDAGEIEVASGIASELSLDNVRLLAMSVEDVRGALPSERFDYVIAHGFYSWIPEAAREALMAVCGALLSERGVAYISYNTLPGFELREVVRDALGFHCRGTTSATQAVERARALLEVLVTSPLANSSPLVKSELLAASKANDARLVYDDLGETDAFHFADVVEHASRHGLRYLGEAVPTRAHLHSFGGSAGRRLAELESDRLAQESLLDALMLRRFRRSLFCRVGAPTTAPTARPRLDTLHALARFERPDPSAISKSWSLAGLGGTKVEVASPHTRAALWCLGASFPSSQALPELRNQAATLAQRHAPGTKLLNDDAFEAALLELFEAGIVDLLGEPATCGAASPRPIALPYGRLAASRGRPVTNLHHRQVELKPQELRLLQLLDGRRDVPQLAAEMGLAQSEPHGVRELLAHLAQSALLNPAE